MSIHNSGNQELSGGDRRFCIAMAIVSCMFAVYFWLAIFVTLFTGSFVPAGLITALVCTCAAVFGVGAWRKWRRAYGLGAGVLILVALLLGRLAL